MCKDINKRGLQSPRLYNFPGGNGLEETPDPFPNSAVKLKDAYGTAGATPWESRSPPGLCKPFAIKRGAYFILERLNI